jgi:formate dehydrogenase major subunit
MPADPGEVEDAEAEGVTLDLLVAPSEVLAENGAVKALRCQRMRLGEPDASGRRRPVPIDGAACVYACNTVIAAIGQDVDLSGLETPAPGAKLALARNQAIAVDATSMATSLEGVFAAGDVVTGPAAAVDAIGAGHRAADAIDRYLRPAAQPARPAESASRRARLVPLEEESLTEIARVSRIAVPKLPPEARVDGFAEVDATPERSAVAQEAARCLSCGCTAALRCELRRHAERYGARQTRFAGRVKRHRVDARHPYVSLDPGKCILCGKCIRLCADLIGVAALGFVHRGFETLVRPSLERPLAQTNCISCGNCIEVCPTGALDFRFGADSNGPWRAVPSRSVCDGCGDACGLVVHHAGDRVSFVTAGGDGGGAKGELCARGRFGHSYLAAPERLRQARIREDGATRAVTVAEAVREAARRLLGVVERHGPGAVALLVSPRATNEEIFLIERLARMGFHTNNVGSLHALARAHLGAGPTDAVGLLASTVPATHLDVADVLVTVNADPVADNPVFGFRLKRAIRRGAQLFSVAADESRTAAIATTRLAARRGTSTLLLSAVAAEILRAGRVDRRFVADRTEGFDELARALRAVGEVSARTGVNAAELRGLAEALADPRRKVVVLYDADSLRERAEDDLRAILNVLLLTGKLGTPRGGLLLLRESGNGQGLVDMGATPDAATPDDRRVVGGSRSATELSTLLRAGSIRGLLVVGEDPGADAGLAPLLESAEVLVAIDALETGTTRAAHVCWPAAPVVESTGSVTAFDRRVRSFAPALRSAAPGAGLAAIAELLATVTGGPPPGLAAIRRAMVERHPAYAPIASLEPGGSFYWSDAPAGGELLYGERFGTADGRAHLRAPDLEPTLLVRRAPTYSATDAWLDRERARLFGADALARSV